MLIRTLMRYNNRWNSKIKYKYTSVIPNEKGSITNVSKNGIISFPLSPNINLINHDEESEEKIKLNKTNKANKENIIPLKKETFLSIIPSQLAITPSENGLMRIPISSDNCLARIPSGNGLAKISSGNDLTYWKHKSYIDE